MNRSKGSLISLSVGLIIFVTYCSIVFLAFNIKNPTVFWMSFAFMCVAFAVQTLGPVLFFKNVNSETVFFGIPILYLGAFYFFAELFASLVFMVFQSVNWKAALLVQVVLLVIFVVGALVSIRTQEAVQTASDDRRNEAVVFKAQVVDIETLADQYGEVDDGDLRRRLEHLAETVRYSDPFGRNEPIIQDLEVRITQKTTDLQALCASGEVAQAQATIADLENLYMERRRKVMLVK